MSKDSINDHIMNISLQHNITDGIQNKQPLKIGRGRGHLFKILNQSINENPKILPPNTNMKRHFIPNNGQPFRSTYIPKEFDENDEAIYETGINSGINFEKFDEIEVKVTGQNIPDKIENFELFKNMPEKLLENIKMCKFNKPTPIQKYTIPIIVSGKDLMATAQTGSGKTVAFVLPIIQKMLMEPFELIKDDNHSEPQVIIMAPTRELVIQIKTVVMKLSRGTGISSLVCYGGTSVSYQKNQIIKGCHILVATPGRLNEFVQHGFITFSSVRFFVLDEVDRMLSIESKSDIDKILDHFSMPSVINRQTIMLSATLPDAIQQLAAYYLNKNYIFLAVGIISSASKDIKQQFYLVNNYKKRSYLTDILKQNLEKTIVFVEKKWTADFLATYLCEKHIPSTSIHGDRLQDQREIALNDFVKGKINVLVATSVASRGLDIKYVNHIINYDLPREIDEYVQRIGRTGRLGNQGTATSFFDSIQDHHLVEPIIKILSSANNEIPLWLHKLGQEIKDREEYDDFDEFGGIDIRIKSNSIDENETW